MNGEPLNWNFISVYPIKKVNSIRECTQKHEKYTYFVIEFSMLFSIDEVVKSPISPPLVGGD